MRLKSTIGKGKHKKMRCMQVIEGKKKHQCKNARIPWSIYCMDHTIMSRRRKKYLLRWWKNVHETE